ncbi:MAG: hypothetical protein A3F67_05450 [Verrucomicrobia bacterium RIFCSPHIGHO2_12_FULL_41_10]|nr:MAG: hypothetical protein A3F67_05450 [Verrucomicrobia bacterium RIFCSPHIGHO2_12_FULL_41_10]HLB32598.1 hypothetical protein [Chthoniobacterales bacterium]
MLLEPVFKVAEADEEQGVDGAQKLSVQELLDASSTDATKLFAAEVDCENRFLVLIKREAKETKAFIILVFVVLV